MVSLSPFKSLVKHINTFTDIEIALFPSLNYQHSFKKHISPFEKNECHIFCKNVNSFTIKPAMIDRLYYLNTCSLDEDVHDYVLFCRMWYEDTPYFLAMTATSNYCGFECKHCSDGIIVFCKSAQFFLQHILCSYYNSYDYVNMIDEIYLSLLQDGYEICKPDHLYYIATKFRRNAPPLQFLCIEYIYKTQDKLLHFRHKLPQLLVNSVDELIKCKQWSKNL